MTANSRCNKLQKDFTFFEKEVNEKTLQTLGFLQGLVQKLFFMIQNLVQEPKTISPLRIALRKPFSAYCN